VVASKTKTAQCMTSSAVGLAIKPGVFGVICVVGLNLKHKTKCINIHNMHIIFV
jgi:hypothetical protein